MSIIVESRAKDKEKAIDIRRHEALVWNCRRMHLESKEDEPREIHAAMISRTRTPK